MPWIIYLYNISLSKALDPECCPCHWYSCCFEVRQGEVPCWWADYCWNCWSPAGICAHGDSWPGGHQACWGKSTLKVFLSIANDVRTATHNQFFIFTTPQGLAMNHKIQENPVLREIVMLGYGTLVAKYCAENPTCPAELVRVCIIGACGIYY